MIYFVNKINALNGWFICTCLLFIFLFVSIFLNTVFTSSSDTTFTFFREFDVTPGNVPSYHLPHGPLEPTISVTIFPGGLQATLNEIISTTPASMCHSLVLASAINGLHATLNERTPASPASVWASLVLVSKIYSPRSITSS